MGMGFGCTRITHVGTGIGITIGTGVCFFLSFFFFRLLSSFWDVV